MESIQQVKKAEAEAIKEVEQAAKKADWIIEKAREKTEKEKENLLEITRKKLADRLATDIVSIEKEGKKIKDEGRKQAMRIKREVEDKIPRAVATIIDEVVR